MRSRGNDFIKDLKHYTIPVFIPELACPFQCVFCNQRKITGRNLIPDDKEITTTIETHLKTFKEKKRHVEIGFFGGSFTGIPLKQQIHYFELVQPYLDLGEVSGIRLSTRPDYIDAKLLKLLKSYGVKTIELGAQSLDDEVLKASCRGHTVAQVESASKMIQDNEIDLGLQMMIGLPGDTLEKSIKTAHRIVELEASNTRIYPTVVIKGTVLEKWFKTGKFTPLSLEEAITWAKQILPIFEDAGLTILRVGLHPSEGLLNGEELIAGPFHQSFKELVLTEIWADLLRPLFNKHNSEFIKISVPKREINYAIGYRGKNRKMLERMFRKVIFLSETNLSKREFLVRYDCV